MTKPHPLQSLIDAPLADPIKIFSPGGKRPAPRSPKIEYADDIGVPKLTSKQVRERKDKAAAQKLDALLTYYAGTDLPAEKIAEHLGLYRQEQTGVDDKGKPTFARVLDVKRVEREMAWRRAK